MKELDAETVCQNQIDGHPHLASEEHVELMRSTDAKRTRAVVLISVDPGEIHGVIMGKQEVGFPLHKQTYVELGSKQLRSSIE